MAFIDQMPGLLHRQGVAVKSFFWNFKKALLFSWKIGTIACVLGLPFSSSYTSCPLRPTDFESVGQTRK